MIKSQLVGCFVLLAIGLPALVHAADCQAVKDSVKQERSLLKKRALLEQGIKECPKDAGMNYLFGYSAERLRKYDEAIQYYGIASELDPAMDKAYFGLGDIYMTLEKPEFAIRAYQKGLKINPKNSRAAKSLELARSQHKGTPPVPEKKIAPVKVVEKKPKVKSPPPKELAAVEQKKPVVKVPKSIAVPPLKIRVPFDSSTAALSQGLQKARQAGKILDGDQSQGALLARQRDHANKNYLIDSAEVTPERLVIPKIP